MTVYRFSPLLCNSNKIFILLRSFILRLSGPNGPDGRHGMQLLRCTPLPCRVLPYLVDSWHPNAKRSLVCLYFVFSLRPSFIFLVPLLLLLLIKSFNEGIKKGHLAVPEVFL